MRLDKYISNTTELSRSQAKRAIAKGRVIVDGQPCTKSETQINPSSTIQLDEKKLTYREHVYLILNKPQGYVCSTRDPDYPTILELIPEEFRPKEPHAAGRLDADTTGLVLLTDDGKWSHSLTAPKRGKEKEYQVTTAQPIPQSAIQAFEQGVYLDGDETITRPARLTIHQETQATLVITEGRFHQVKRMFESIDNEVTVLHRSRIDAISLPLDLPLGKSRELTQEELASLEA